MHSMYYYSAIEINEAFYSETIMIPKIILCEKCKGKLCVYGMFFELIKAICLGIYRLALRAEQNG